MTHIAPKRMAHWPIALCFAATIFLPSAVVAQTAPIPVTVDQAEGGFKTGPVMPVGLSMPAWQLKGDRFPSAEKQIRVKIRYVMLDPATRKEVYARLGWERLKTFGSKVPLLHSDHDQVGTADTSGTEAIAKSSRVTTCVLSGDEATELLQDVASKTHCNVTRAPSIVLIDGQDTSVTDLVQRPFVVNLESETTDLGPAVNSVMQVLNEGISVQLNASVTPSGRIHVASNIILEKILDVETEEVYGVGKEPMQVQVPVHHRKVVRATENLQAGETLLVDPYVQHQSQVSQTTSVPILSEIPYLSDSFKNTELVDIDQHMVVLIEPSMEAAVAPPLPRQLKR